MSEVDDETAAVPPSPSAIPLSDSIEGDHQHCLVCYSTLDHPGILPCDHNEICGVCHLRLRHLHSNKKCPICKTDNEKIVVDTPEKKFNDYPMWGDDLGTNFVYRQDVGIFFPKEYFATVIEPLFGYHCTVKGCQFDGTIPEANIYDQMQEETEEENNKKHNQKKKKPQSPLHALRDHLRVKHRLTLCQLCIDHKRDFVALLPRMAPHELKKHQTKGDPGSGFDGHPVCEFCRPTRFYDLAHLHMHLQREHYKCHVCEKRGMQNQYFRNYQSLEKHFDREHFMCHDVQCLQARFVVFENDIDLHAHERQVHGGTSTGSSKIQLEFRTRRTGYDGSGVEGQRQEVPSEEDFNFGLQGEAFVPQALPQNSDLTLHPLHIQRTAEFREQAAQMREQQDRNMRGEAFPTLQEAATADGSGEGTTPGQRLNIGWTSQDTMNRVAAKKKNAGTVTEEDFPTLPTSAAPKRGADAKLRAGANRQFAAMSSAARQPVRSTPASGGWAGSAAAVAAQPAASPYQYNSAAFPQAHTAARNREEDLQPENFPALGGGTKKAPKYQAATNLTKKYQGQQQAPSWNSSIDFPAAPTAKKSVAGGNQRPVPSPAQQRAPSLNNQMEFPPPPSASASSNAMKSVLGAQKKQPSKAAMANMLQAPQSLLGTPSNPQDILRDMQAALGPTKYKQLKKCTREFAGDELAPDAFIDHAAALFDRGYADPDFKKCIPALVASCPNQGSANEALRYMESLRTPAKPVPSPTLNLAAAPPPPSNNWGSSALNLTPSSFPIPSASTFAAPGGRGNGFVGAPKVAAAPTTRYIVPTGKSKTAWGGGAPATKVMQPKKQPPGLSVAAAAASQGPQIGTATKYMAKQSKQQQQQQTNTQTNQGKNKNKKKEKDELRKLAFGR